MKRFLLYSIPTIVLIILSLIFQFYIYAFLLIIFFSAYKLVRELFSVDITILKYLGIVVSFFILITSLYGFIYFLLPASSMNPDFQQSINGVIDAIYFSFVTITTLGYGDFKPVSPLAKIIVISQIIIGILVIAVAANYVIGKYQSRTTSLPK